MTELEALLPWGYVAAVKLCALVVVLACIVCLTNAQRWRRGL